MAENDPQELEKPGPASDSEPEEERVSTPFDNPYFLPVLLWAFAAWFGYDGFLNTDEHMQEHLSFNRYGFPILVVLAAYFTWRGIQEKRESEKSDS